MSEQKLSERMREGCKKCKGAGIYEAHQPGHTHYETDAGEPCPWFHYSKIPCGCVFTEINQKVAALEASNERMRDLVRYKRHELFDNDLISREEFASLVSETPGAVVRLEGYDKAKAEFKARVAALEEQLEQAQRERGETESLLASTTDLLNSWARESGVTETYSEKGIKVLANDLWSCYSTQRQKRIEAEYERDQLRARAERAEELLSAYRRQHHKTGTALDFEGELKYMEELNAEVEGK